MKREEFKKRVKRLLVSLLVVGIFLGCNPEMLTSVRATEADPDLTFQLNYDPNGGTITSDMYEYTSLVTAESENSTSASGIIFPTVEYDGHIFIAWLSKNSGYYNANTQTLDWSGLSVADLVANGWTFTAQWRKENLIQIKYIIDPKFADWAKVNENTVTEYRESIFPEVNISVPEVDITDERYICIGFCEYSEETGEESPDIYQGTVTCKYVDEDGTGGKTTTYTYLLKFAEAPFINITYDTNNEAEDSITEEIIYQKDLNESVYEMTVPEAPEYTNHRFMGWQEWITGADGTETLGREQFYEAGEAVTIAFGEKRRYVAQWEWAIESGAVDMSPGANYKFAEGYFQVDGDTTVYCGGETNMFYVPEKGTYTFKKVKQ